MMSEFNFNDFLFGLFFKIYYFWVRFVNYWREDRTLILAQKKCVELKVVCLHMGRIVKVNFHEYTPDGSLRHPRLK